MCATVKHIQEVRDTNSHPLEDTAELFVFRVDWKKNTKIGIREYAEEKFVCW